ncbi:MAG: HAD family phosphatase [Clostridia bacterium]|nr:HAD family phosphatase [Clostridia bacterium]
MKSFKIVASDLDGTLFNSRGEVSPENLAAIEALTRLGVHFVPSTGRTMQEVPSSIKENPNVRYFIHSNGAVVLDKLTGQRLERCLSRRQLDAILSAISSAEAHITVRYSGKTYCDAELNTEEDFGYYNMWGAHADILRNIAVKQTGFQAFLAEIENAEVISVFFHDDGELEECRERLLKIPSVNIAVAADHNLEIFHSSAGKGASLHALADMLGVEHGDTIAVGDSGNDLTIVEAAGLGLAVSNSCPELLAAADEVICSNDNHAIKFILEHYFK